jgi:predicted DNA-binding protein YlxM (UPF0122 family)
MGTSPNSIHIYLDESGDLGWTFTAPYGAGGSSRFLTIASVCVPPAESHLPKRLVKNMYVKYNWPSGIERKFVQLLPSQRLEFAQDAKALCDAHPEIAIHAIVVKKQNVQQHIQQDANKLYNYMIKLSLIKKMAKHQVVTLMPDQRSIKVRSGNSMWDYLQTELWFTENAITALICQEQDSAHNRGVQFADFVSGIVQAKYERNDFRSFSALRPRLTLTELFF